MIEKQDDGTYQFVGPHLPLHDNANYGFKTIAQMRDFDERGIPDAAGALCYEDGGFYVYKRDNEFDETTGRWRKQNGGGEKGTKNYNELENRPQISGEVLEGDKSAADLGLLSVGDIVKIESPLVTTEQDGTLFVHAGLTEAQVADIWNLLKQNKRVEILSADDDGRTMVFSPSLAVGNGDNVMTISFSCQTGGGLSATAIAYGNGDIRFEMPPTEFLKSAEVRGGAAKITALDGSVTRINGLPSRFVKIKDFSFEADYGDIDWDAAEERTGSPHPEMEFGGCSAFFYGGNLYASYDFNYDKKNYAVVRTRRTIAVCGSLHDWTADDEGNEDALRFLPFAVLRGRNDAGLSIAVLLVDNEFGAENCTPTGSIDKEISSILLPRYLLENFGSASDACDWVKKHCKVLFPSDLLDAGKVVHFLVCDKSSSYALEFKSDGTKITAIDRLSNFYVDGVTLNDDGTVYTNATQDAEHSAIKTNHIQPLGKGLERWNTMTLGLASGKTTLQVLLYSQTYLDLGDFSWFSEFTGVVGTKTFTVDTPTDDADFVAYIEAARAQWAVRSRETGKTDHSCVQSIFSDDFVDVDFQEEMSWTKFQLSRRVMPAEIPDIYVKFNAGQSLSEAQKATARNNIGAMAQGGIVPSIYLGLSVQVGTGEDAFYYVSISGENVTKLVSDFKAGKPVMIGHTVGTGGDAYQVLYNIIDVGSAGANSFTAESKTASAPERPCLVLYRRVGATQVNVQKIEIVQRYETEMIFLGKKPTSSGQTGSLSGTDLAKIKEKKSPFVFVGSIQNENYVSDYYRKVGEDATCIKLVGLDYSSDSYDSEAKHYIDTLLVNKSTGNWEFDRLEVPSKAVLYSAQSLTQAQKTQARNNIGAIDSIMGAVRYDTTQSLNDSQKARVRSNITTNNSWVNWLTDSGNHSIKYKRIDNFVFFKVMGYSVSGQVKVGTLPAEVRPLEKLCFCVSGDSDKMCYGCIINPSGETTIYGKSGLSQPYYGWCCFPVI